MDPATLKLVTFSFILSIIFPTFAYTFTTFGEEPFNFDITLGVDELINAGIQLSDAEAHNVTFGGAPQEYTVKNTTMRVKWVDRFLLPDYFANQQQDYISKVLDTWAFGAEEMDWIMDPAAGFLPSTQLTNETVIDNFDTQYNWTRYTLVQNSLTVFITATKPDDGNITKAITDTGIVTVTVASQVFDSETINFENFGKWYINVVTGSGGDWGLPSFMSWVVRIFSFLTLLSGILLAKEFVPFLN